MRTRDLGIRTRHFAAQLAIVAGLGLASVAAAQTHAPATEPAATQAAQPPAPADAQTAGHATPAVEHGGTAEHRNPTVDLIARLINFGILAGTLVYFLKSPFNDYLSNRKTQIRADLVNASDMKASAALQLAAVHDKLAALPAELDTLRTAGASEVATEEARIREMAEKERQRLLTQLQREIELHGRSAERDLVRHAADRAVAAATGEIRRTMTSTDHARLQERYVEMVGK